MAKGKRARLSLYLKDDALRRQIKVAAAKRDMSVTDYCTKAIEQQLIRDGEVSLGKAPPLTREDKLSLSNRMDRLREEIGPIGISVSELIKEGRRR